MSYRPEIDGLRTVAVMPVVLFHAGFAGFSGGFTGVDVFFVISGYLIAGIILGEVAGGRFSIRRFYARRVRRIIPALLVVLAATLAATSIVALPDQLVATGWSAIAAVFSVSNVWFWRQSGYFSPATEFVPLLHTWSLGVEEQFYIVFPVLVVLLAALRVSVRWALALLALPAFALSVWLSYRAPSFAFYQLPARAWELGLGALLAAGVFPAFRNRVAGEVAAAVGLALILFGMIWIDSAMVFPGWVALLPCVGTLLVIHGTAGGGGGMVRRLLSTRVMVFIGLISYSLYLWHWPVFAVMRLHSASIHLTAGQGAAGVALSIVLATLSWRYVERPFRRGMPFRRVAAATLGGAAVILAASIALIASNGMPGRLGDEGRLLLSASGDVDPFRAICTEGEDRAACAFGPEGLPLGYAIIGDSHAPSIRGAIDSGIHGLEGRGTLWWRPACPLLDGSWFAADERGPGCLAFKAEVLEALRGAPELDVVFLAGHWEYQLTGRLAEVGGPQTEYLIDAQSTERSAEEAERVFVRSIGRTLDALGAMGKRVIIIGPVPQPGFDVPRIFALADLNHSDGQPRLDAASVREASDRIDEIFRRATEGRPYAHYVPVRDIFCPDECHLIMDGIPLYYDYGHLTTRGAARFLGPKLAERIESALGTDLTGARSP